MEPLLNHLATLLKREVRLYESLIEVFREKKHSIIDGDLKKLDQHRHTEERMLGEIRHMGKRRISILEIVAKHLNLERDGVTLGKIIEKLDEPFKSQFAQLRRKIITTVKEMNLLNKSNAYLLEHSLKQFKVLNDLIARGSERNVIYSKKGNVHGLQPGRTIVLNEVG